MNTRFTDEIYEMMKISEKFKIIKHKKTNIKEEKNQYQKYLSFSFVLEGKKFCLICTVLLQVA